MQVRQKEFPTAGKLGLQCLAKIHATMSCEGRGKEREWIKEMDQDKGGGKKRMEGSKGKGGWGCVSFSTQCKKKDKEKGQRSLG